MAKKSKKRRKSSDEVEVELITWFLLVLIFAILYIVNNNFSDFAFPSWLVPISGALVLLGSGTYQYSKNWRVSPVTWIVGAVLMVFGFVNVTIDPTLDLTGFSLLAFAIVILFGLLTGET